MEDMITDIADRVRENRSDRPSDYFDEKGLRWCGICHERKENEYTFFGEKRILPCLCRCDREAQAERAEQERQREFERRVRTLKSIGLTEVKQDVKVFLQDMMKLEMSDTKTKVTHQSMQDRKGQDVRTVMDYCRENHISSADG